VGHQTGPARRSSNRGDLAMAHPESDVEDSQKTHVHWDLCGFSQSSLVCRERPLSQLDLVQTLVTQRDHVAQWHGRGTLAAAISDPGRNLV